MPTDQDWHTASAAEMRVLQQLQHALPQASLEELAALLQIDILPGRTQPQPDGSGEQTQPVSHLPPNQDDTRPGASSYPPADKIVPFLHLHSMQFKQAQPENPDKPDWYIKSKPFDGKIDSEMGDAGEPEPLLSWRQLWPLLHHLFRDDKPTRRLDTRRLIRHAVKCEPLTAIPWQRYLRWPGELVLLVDYSRHLCPYYNDYQQLTRHLQNWLRERLKLVICVDAEQQQFVYHNHVYSGLPEFVKHTEMLYLGDLGCLDQHGVSCARWHQTGRQLHQRNVRTQALLTVDPSDWQCELMRYYQLHGWNFGRIISAQRVTQASDQERGVFSQAQCQRLMPYLAQAFELTPALIRRMRRVLGLSVSVESLVVQHRALQGNRINFQWRDKAQRGVFRQQLQDCNREQAWTIIRQFEAALPLELQIEQRQQLDIALSEAQRGFIGRFVKSHLQDSLSDSAQELALGWVKRMAQRAADERWGQETHALYALYWRQNKNSADCVIPAGVDTTRLPPWVSDSAEEEQALCLVQQGRQLVLHSVESAESRQSVKLARLHWSEGSVVQTHSRQPDTKQPLRLHSRIALPDDAQTELLIDTPHQRLILKSLTCPPWANGLGQDRYGLFAELTVNNVDLVMRWIPPGEFIMGSSPDEPEREDDEGPQHRVRFSQGFWMAETTCSQALWQTVMDKNPSQFSDDPQNPVDSVSRDLSREFIDRLNQLVPGLAVRLPSEAEWEYACRAGTTTPFWFGAELSTQQANYDGNNPYANGKTGEYRKKTMPVKAFQPNPWGLYQMHGNVWEWCEDTWHNSYDGAPDDGSAWIDTNGEYYVCRGGSWISNGRDLRSAYRDDGPIDIIDDSYGFRLARGPELQSASRGKAQSRL